MYRNMCSPAWAADDLRRELLGIVVDLIDYERAFERVLSWREREVQGSVVFVNPHSIMMAQEDAEFRNALNGASLALPDGAGIVLGAKMRALPHSGRVSGPEFTLRLCDVGREYGYRHYFYGGTPKAVAAIAANLKTSFPGIQVVGATSPPFRTLSESEDAEFVQHINAAHPDILWIGLGAPKQEKWIAAHLDRVKATALIGVGAAFDFLSGVKPWAPRVIRELGCEWAFRLACEPRRLWRRNINSLLFAFRILLDKRIADGSVKHYH